MNLDDDKIIVVGLFGVLCKLDLISTFENLMATMKYVHLEAVRDIHNSLHNMPSFKSLAELLDDGSSEDNKG